MCLSILGASVKLHWTLCWKWPDSMKSTRTSASNFSIKLTFLLYIIDGHLHKASSIEPIRWNLSISKLVAIAVIKK